MATLLEPVTIPPPAPSPISVLLLPVVRCSPEIEPTAVLPGAFVLYKVWNPNAVLFSADVRVISAREPPAVLLPPVVKSRRLRGPNEALFMPTGLLSGSGRDGVTFEPPLPRKLLNDLGDSGVPDSGRRPFRMLMRTAVLVVDPGAWAVRALIHVRVCGTLS
ncbi:hypothetical protein D3C77_555250 [compost metagenome]